jgi:hypothetical protein
MDDHKKWIESLWRKYKNETLEEEIKQEVNLDDRIIFKSHEENFRLEWLEFYPPLLERQFAFSTHT